MKDSSVNSRRLVVADSSKTADVTDPEFVWLWPGVRGVLEISVMLLDSPPLPHERNCPPVTFAAK
jgi:hypothetical protein